MYACLQNEQSVCPIPCIPNIGKMYGMDLVRRVERVRVVNRHLNGRIAFISKSTHNLLRDPPLITAVHSVVHPRSTALAVIRIVTNEWIAVAWIFKPIRS